MKRKNRAKLMFGHHSSDSIGQTHIVIVEIIPFIQWRAELLTDSVRIVRRMRCVADWMLMLWRRGSNYHCKKKKSKTKPVLGLRKGSTTNWLKINHKCYFNFIAVAHSIFKYERKLVFNELSFNRSHRNALEGLNVLTTKWYNNIIINKRLAI